MPMLQRILDVLSHRIASLIGGAMATRVETMVVLEQVDQQEALEERAQQLEKEGKPHLAEALRRRMLGVDPTNPGGQGQAILAQLRDETQEATTPALAAPEADEQEEPKPKRRRRANRRCKSDAAPEEGCDA